MQTRLDDDDVESRWCRVLVCAMIATACGYRTVGAATSVGQAAVEHAATASNQFGYDLYQRLRGKDGNLIFSPASAEFALAMASAGACGETLAQMKVCSICVASSSRTPPSEPCCPPSASAMDARA